MNTVDTIAAIATGTGGAINIIRISGPDALVVGNRVWQGRSWLDAENARRMLLGHIIDLEREHRDAGEPALAVYMPGPASYTGDDVVELHGHGGAAAANKTLRDVLAAGARLAEPGEFTYRAFVNGKMDLTQAEAVCDLIQAQSDDAFTVATRQLSGALSAAIKGVRAQLLTILAECESRLDFPDERLDWTNAEVMCEQIFCAMAEIHNLRESRREGAILRDGVRVVIAGRPNAGKSSLLNRLLGLDRAIVSAIPGTTRDTLEENAVLRRIPVKLIDTAGIREALDEIENIGVARSRQSIEQAQMVFWLLDASAADLEAEVAEFKRSAAAKEAVIAVWNKLDLARTRVLPDCGVPTVKITATTGENFNALLDEFETLLWEFPHTEAPELAVNARHDQLLGHAAKTLGTVPEEFSRAHWELAAVGLREALDDLGMITGETVKPDIFETIFARFCIGK